MRQCKFCGCDISHLRANATICGSSNCKYAYDKWRKNKPKENRFCEICGKNINNLPGQRRICLSEECVAEQKRRKYNTSLKEKTCKKCGSKFLGTLKQTTCENCRNKRDSQSFNYFEQKIVCKNCGKVLRIELKRNIGRNSDVLKEGVCEECKQKNYREASIRMKTNNPTKNKYLWINLTDLKLIETAIDIHFVYNYLPIKIIKPKETLEELKYRMSVNNPMKRKEIKDKVAKTLKTRYSTGEIKTVRGKEHWLWKGNRNFNKSVRIELRNWVKSEFEKVDFTCQKCGIKGSELHVHHLIPLRDIISDILKQENITINELTEIIGSEKYFEIVQKIVKFHEIRDDVGIVVCPKCHHELDSFYKRKTYENKKHKED